MSDQYESSGTRMGHRAAWDALRERLCESCGCAESWHADGPCSYPRTFERLKAKDPVTGSFIKSSGPCTCQAFVDSGKLGAA